MYCIFRQRCPVNCFILLCALWENAFWNEWGFLAAVPQVINGLNSPHHHIASLVYSSYNTSISSALACTQTL